MLIAVLEACVDNYVQSCTPAPRVPVSEVVVKTVTDLATTGGEANVAGIIVAGFFVVAGAALFAYNHLTKKERRDNE